MRIYFFIIFCMLYSCKSYNNYTKQSSCGNIFEVQYDKSKKYLLSENEKNKNYFIFYFEDSFNDKVRIDINQKEILYKQITTNDKTPDNYSYKLVYKMDNNQKYIMHIESESNKTCLELPLEKNYRIIYLFYYKNKWIVRFSNQLRVR